VPAPILNNGLRLISEIMYKLSIYFILLAWAAILLSCGEEAPAPPACSTPPQIAAIEVVNATCSAANGSLVVKADSGTGSLTYSLNGKAFQSSNIFEQLPAGSYTIEVKDEEDCLVSQEVEIGEQSTLSVAVVSTTESGCGHSEGSVQLSAAGGEAAYSYSLDGEAYQEKGIFERLEAKEYSAYVKDAAGCVETEMFAIRSGISFDASVKSIIETNCAISGCHVAGTGRSDFTQFSVIQDKASTIKNYTQSGYMPPQGSGKSLSSDEIAAIACWVNDGAPQN
jgi:hypothetical protein